MELLELDSIVVNSPLLKAVLEEVFDGYPGITTDFEALVFTSPFQPFVHQWSEFEKTLDGNWDDQARSRIDVL